MVEGLRWPRTCFYEADPLGRLHLVVLLSAFWGCLHPTWRPPEWVPASVVSVWANTADREGDSQRQLAGIAQY